MIFASVSNSREQFAIQNGSYIVARKVNHRWSTISAVDKIGMAP